MAAQHRNWQIGFRNKRKIFKAIAKMRASTRNRFYEALEDMKAEGPSPKNWVVGPMEGGLKGYWRLKIDYRHRMVYEVFNDVLIIEIVEVSSREGAYK